MGNSLRVAAKSGDIQTVRRKISLGSDVNKRSENGYTPLHWAGRCGRIKVIAELIDNKADINSQTNVFLLLTLLLAHLLSN